MARHHGSSGEPRHSQLSSGDARMIGLRKPAKRRYGWGRPLLLVVAVVAAAIWFAPTVIIKSSLRHWLTTMALGDFPGKLVIGSGSCGWLTPLELQDVTIWDANENPIARIPMIRSEKHLLGFASAPNQLGAFHLYQPTIQVAVTQDSSNVEELLEALAKLTASEETDASAGGGIGVEVHILEGRVLLQDTVTGESCSVENLNAELKLPQGAPDPLTVHLSADVQQAAERGNVSATFSWQMPETIHALDWGDGQLQWIAKQFPLVSLRPFLRRVLPDLQLTGQLASNAGCRWQRGSHGPHVQGQGDISIVQLQLLSASLLGNDALRLDRLATTIDLATDEKQVALKSIQFQTDFADLTISGNAELPELLATSDIARKLLDWRSSHQFNVQGQIDVARAAAILPETLQLRDGMQIQRGGVTLDLDSRIEMGHRLVRGSVQSDRIDATHQGRAFSWDQPFQVALDGVSSEGGVQIRKLTCNSDFLQLDARGTLREGTVSATGDLRKLATQLAEFCDLGDLELTGQLTAEGQWNQTPDQQITAGMKAVVRQFAMATAGMTAVREAELTIQTDAAGVLGPTGIDRLDSARLQITSGGDDLVVTIPRSVSQPFGSSRWPVTCRLTGDSDSWLARTQPWVSLGGWDLHAGINATANGELDSQEVRLDACQIQLTNFNLRGGGLLVREPNVTLEGTAVWNVATSQLVLPTFTFVSSALAARGSGIEVALAAGNVTAQGIVAYRGDLQRLYGWQYATLPPTLQPKGQFDGQMNVTTDGKTITLEGATDISMMSVEQRVVMATGAGPWSVLWSEPDVRMSLDGTYDPSTDAIQWKRAELVGSSVSLAMDGGIGQLMTNPTADLRGAMNYDLAILANQLRSTLGPEIQIAGRRSAPFTVRGPLWADSSLGGGAVAAGMVSHELIAETTLGWDSLLAYGMAVGPQEIQARLEQGIVRFSPLETSLAQGRIAVAPRIELNANPIMLVIDPGMVAEGIQITPEMCAGWFKYVAPILAEATTAEGRMSVTLQGARIPLSDPMSASVAGSIAIESARIQSGPLAEQLLGTINEVAAIVQRSAPELGFLQSGKNLLELTPQQIEFQMTQGRVFHRNLEFRSGNVALRTQGWVGVDQSIGLLAEIPIRDEWTEKNPLLADLKGQSVQLPIQGSFSRPQIDRRAIAQLSSQLIGNTAQRLLQDEVQKGLKKLLGPK